MRKWKTVWLKRLVVEIKMPFNILKGIFWYKIVC